MTIRLARATFALVVGASASGCVNMARYNALLPGGVDPQSPIAAQVESARQAPPGPYPRFSQIPPMPTDVRPVSGWRATVDDVLASKRQTDAQVAAYPFTLSDTAGFAASAQARIPPTETVAPSDSAAKASDDYAAGARKRANLPPPTN